MPAFTPANAERSACEGEHPSQLSAAEAAAAFHDLEQRIRERYPTVKHVFIEAPALSESRGSEAGGSRRAMGEEKGEMRKEEGTRSRR